MAPHIDERLDERAGGVHRDGTYGGLSHCRGVSAPISRRSRIRPFARACSVGSRKSSYALLMPGLGARLVAKRTNAVALMSRAVCRARATLDHQLVPPKPRELQCMRQLADWKA